MVSSAINSGLSHSFSTPVDSQSDLLLHNVGDYFVIGKYSITISTLPTP